MIEPGVLGTKETEGLEGREKSLTTEDTIYELDLNDKGREVII